MLLDPINGSRSSMPNVLLVEDDDDTRDSLRALLEHRGWRVAVAPHGRAALDLLRSSAEPIGLIVLDLMMPVMDGWTLRQELLRDPALASIPVVIVSGVGDLVEGSTALRPAAFLPKPIPLQRLYAIVAETCGDGSGDAKPDALRVAT